MEPEFLFETLLFYNSSPSYYKVYLAGDIFIGEPTPHHYYTKTDFPHFIVRTIKQSRHVEGIDDPRMIRNILFDLDFHTSICMLR